MQSESFSRSVDGQIVAAATLDDTFEVSDTIIASRELDREPNHIALDPEDAASKINALAAELTNGTEDETEEDEDEEREGQGTEIVPDATAEPSNLSTHSPTTPPTNSPPNSPTNFFANGNSSELAAMLFRNGKLSVNDLPKLLKMLVENKLLASSRNGGYPGEEPAADGSCRDCGKQP